jgi:2-succinyl-5-enolpyruvyl-6-hydroxy-3-cyclohexene-1-carboxylate synthase
MRQLSQHIPEGSLVYLGNSRPVRDWNEHAESQKKFSIFESRGLNGIDGQLSTFYGLSRPGENWAVVGDLTALYDLQAPWALRYLSPNVRTRVVVINNSGGQIFDKMYPSQLFINAHELNFKALADMWGVEYSRSLNVSSHHALIELAPDVEQTRRFRQEWDQL